MSTVQKLPVPVFEPLVQVQGNLGPESNQGGQSMYCRFRATPWFETVR